MKPLGTEVLLRAKASAEPVDDFGRKVGVVSPVVFFESGMGLKPIKTWRSQWKNHL